jgi:Flp pilus assembly protein TadD
MFSMKTGLRVRIDSVVSKESARLGFASRELSFRLAMALVTASLLWLECPLSSAQATGGTKTVRRHRVQDVDPDAAKVSQAEAAIDKKDYATAESLLKEVTTSHADNYAAWYDLGFVYHAEGKREDSVAAYRKSVEAKPNVFESNLNLGLALAEMVNAEAEQYLRTATKLKPASNPGQGQKRAWMALGHLLQGSKPEDALEAYRQAAVADPKDPEPHLLAGSILEKQKSADAEQEYQLALARDAQNPEALAALTNFYMAQHRFGDAESLLRKLIVVHPNDASAHFQLGRMLAIAGKNDDAIAELQAGLKLDAADVKAQRDLADLYAENKKFDEAQKVYASLLASAPNDPELHHGLGRALLMQKKFGDAERELMKSAQLKPGVGEVYGDLAVAANENKDYPTAIRAADLRAKYLPENPMTYFLRATAYDHMRDSKQASRYYHQFLDSAGGKFPEQEWQAKHRLIAIEPRK